MSTGVEVFRMRPGQGIELGGYDFDAIAVEYYEEALAFDFRLELGSGLGIYWALPIERNGRLRLFHVDGAAYTLDEPELEADPWICDLPRREWRGDLGTFDDGTQLLGVAIEAAANPASYRCEVQVRRARGTEELVVFNWKS
jgi:hypothetical protein